MELSQSIRNNEAKLTKLTIIAPHCYNWILFESYYYYSCCCHGHRSYHIIIDSARSNDTVYVYYITIRICTKHDLVAVGK